jgi:hypothetical protein
VSTGEAIGTAQPAFRCSFASSVEPDIAKERIVAVGLLTRPDLDRLGPLFTRAWPVDETPCFSQLLQAIDEADRETWRERDQDSD